MTATGDEAALESVADELTSVLPESVPVRTILDGFLSHEKKARPPTI